MQQGGTGFLERIQAALSEAGLDCVILVSPANVYYASGADILTSRLSLEQPSFVVVPGLGESAMVVCDWEEGFAKSRSHIGDVRSYTLSSSALRVLVDLLCERDLEASRLGVEERYLRAVDYRQLVTLLPHAELLPCDELMLKLRAIKTSEEIELLRHAAICTEKAIYATFVTARPGITEKEMAGQISYHLYSFGAVVPYDPLLTAGVNSTVLHLLPSDKQIVHGEVVHVDTFVSFSGYWSDISRNAVVGQPSPQQRSTYKQLWEMQQRIIEEMRVGTRASYLYRLYQDLSKREGFPAPMSTLGHGLGLKDHELPELDLDHDTELQAGMVLSVEPTVIIPGDARYDIEDTVLVREEGPELLSAWHSAQEMFVIE